MIHHDRSRTAAVIADVFFFFQAEDGIRVVAVTGVQTCALPILTTAQAVGADSHGDGKFTRRVGSRTNGLRRRHLLCFLHRFHKSSRVRAPAKSLLRFRRRDVVPNRRRNVYLRYYSAAFASFRAPIPTSPLSASRLPTPRLWGTIRVYFVPLIGHVR